MTQPSAFLAAVVERLQERLPAPVRVLALDARFGTQGKDFYTLPRPSVVVTLDNLVMEGDYDPPVATAQLAAYVLTDIASPHVDLISAGTLGAVDLAAAVQSIVTRERWDGHAYSASSRIRATNENSARLAQEGLSIWLVYWTQQIELTATDVDATLHNLRKIHITFAMGDADTPDQYAEIPLPGAS